MDENYRYCEHCGNVISTHARFCGKCGASAGAPASSEIPTTPLGLRRDPASASGAPAASGAVTAPFGGATVPLGGATVPLGGAPAPAYAASTSESMMGVIPGALRKSGLLGMRSEAFHIVVTNQRLIFARQTSEMMKSNVQQARQSAKEQGKGFLSQWGAQFGANNGVHYLQMHPQAILNEQPDNFFVFSNQVREARIHESTDDDTQRSDYRLKLKTATGDITMHFSNLDENNTRQLLRQALGHAFR